MKKCNFSLIVSVAIILNSVVTVTSCDDEEKDSAEAGAKMAQEMCECFKKQSEAEGEACAYSLYDKYERYVDNDVFEKTFFDEFIHCDADAPSWWTGQIGGGDINYFFDRYNQKFDKFKEVIRISYLIDATLTQEYNSYPVLANFSFTATDNTVRSLWEASYDAILNYNYLLANMNILQQYAGVEYIESDIASAKYHRAYVYYVLLNYFGEVPIITSVNMTQAPRTSRQLIENFIIEECNFASQFLPEWGDLSYYAPLQIKARVELNRGNYLAALGEAMNIIANISHSGTDAISFGLDITMPQQMIKYEMVYPVRYAEAVLLAAEASLGAQDLENAVMLINMFDNMFSSSTPDEIMAKTTELWNEQLDSEGHTFARLKRAGTAAFLNALGPYGATEKHMLLPVPQSARDANPNLTQNNEW